MKRRRKGNEERDKAGEVGERRIREGQCRKKKERKVNGEEGRRDKIGIKL